MDAYIGFTKEDLEALLGIALNGILADQPQVGKGAIRPPSRLLPIRPTRASTPVPLVIQAQPSLVVRAIHQQQPYSQRQLRRPRWPKGLRVRSN